MRSLGVTSVAETYRIGPFLLDAEAQALTQDGKPVALGQRAVAVLVVLVRATQEYVPKTRIMEVAWPGMVVEENNLSVQISAIRRVLAHAPDGEGWLETLARRGYRFVGPVTAVPNKTAGDTLSSNPRSNLPESLTSFVGRERELAEVRKMLSEIRLVTLTGAGGVGKTRLALRVAAELIERFPDGVWLVEFAALWEPGLVPQTVATVLGLKEEPSKSLMQTFVEHLQGKCLLLVLDNAEHLLGACAELVEVLLRQCSQVTLLVTSREQLGVTGELIYRVPSLSTPELSRDATAHSLVDYESVRLFTERAQFQLPQFAVSDRNAPALASICQHLDGIPLAIELAAARVRSMSVEEVNHRLDQRFRLLTGGSRTAPRRQQTLRAALDWSYDLLSDAEKALLGRLSVFAGGWMLESAEHVGGGEDVQTWEMLDLLTALADKNLVETEEREGATRYRLLETVRQYAQELLRERGEEPLWQGRHLMHFLALAEEAEPELKGKDQQPWLDRLETEHDNLRAALAWATTAGGDAAGGLRLAGALWRFWLVRGYLCEGQGWLSGLLAAAPRGQAAARAKALHGAGVLAWQQGYYGAARALHEQSLAIQRELGDRQAIAGSLNNLGLVAWQQGDYAAARALYEQSLAIRRELGDRQDIAGSLNNFGLVAYRQGDYLAAIALYEESLTLQRELGDRQGIAASLNNLGNVANDQGDYSAARALLVESLTTFRELGDRHGIAMALTSLGNVADEQGDYSAARALYEQSLAIRRELGDRHGIAVSLTNLGMQASHQGDYSAARALYAESLVIARELGDRRGIAMVLNNQGLVAYEHGDYLAAIALCEETLALQREMGDRQGIASSLEGLAYIAFALAGPGRAGRIWAGAERLREEIGCPLPPSDRPRYERLVAAARAAIGDNLAFDLAWQEGRAMGLEQAIEYALEKTDA